MDAIARADAALGMAGAGHHRSKAFMKGALAALDEASQDEETEEAAVGEGEGDGEGEGEGGDPEAEAGDVGGEGEEEEEAAESEGSEEVGEAEVVAAHEKLAAAIDEGEASAADAADGAESESEAPLAIEDGIRIHPIPGMTEPPVTVGSPLGLPVDLATTTAFAGTHAYNEDIKSLLREKGAAGDRIASLRLSVVEKVNFYESLMKRANLIKGDIEGDQGAMKALQAHAAAVTARIDRLKGESA